MIGSGIYLLPASLGAIGSISLFGWITALLGAGILGLVFCGLTILLPQRTGLFSHIEEAFGPGGSFVAGVLYWVPTSLGPPALAVTGYLGFFLPALRIGNAAMLTALAVLWSIIGANMIGPRFVARVGGLTAAVRLGADRAGGGWRMALFPACHLRGVVERLGAGRAAGGVAGHRPGFLRVCRRRECGRRGAGDAPAGAKRADRHAGRTCHRGSGLSRGDHGADGHDAGGRTGEIQRAVRGCGTAGAWGVDRRRRRAVRHAEGRRHAGRLDAGGGGEHRKRSSARAGFYRQGLSREPRGTAR